MYLGVTSVAAAFDAPQSACPQPLSGSRLPNRCEAPLHDPLVGCQTELPAPPVDAVGKTLVASAYPLPPSGFTCIVSNLRRKNRVFEIEVKKVFYYVWVGMLGLDSRLNAY